jgi:hypothetical protein
LGSLAPLARNLGCPLKLTNLKTLSAKRRDSSQSQLRQNLHRSRALGRITARLWSPVNPLPPKPNVHAKPSQRARNPLLFSELIIFSEILIFSETMRVTGLTQQATGDTIPTSGGSFAAANSGRSMLWVGSYCRGRVRRRVTFIRSTSSRR